MSLDARDVTRCLATALGGGSLFGAAVAPPVPAASSLFGAAAVPPAPAPPLSTIEVEIPEGAPNVTIDVPPGATRFEVFFYP